MCLFRVKLALCSQQQPLVPVFWKTNPSADIFITRLPSHISSLLKCSDANVTFILHLLFCRSPEYFKMLKQCGAASDRPAMMQRMKAAARLFLILTIEHYWLPHLLFSGHLSSDQQPEKALRQRLLASWSFGQQLLTLRNAVTPETDSLWIKDKGFKSKYTYIKVTLCAP